MTDEWLVAGTGRSIEGFSFDRHSEKTLIGCNAIGKLVTPDYYWLSDPSAIRKFGSYVEGCKWVTDKIIIDGEDRTDRNQNWFDYDEFDYSDYVPKEPDHVIHYSECFRREEFSEENFRCANLAGFSCLSFIAHYFDPEKIYIAGFDGYEYGNEHFYDDPDHGPDADFDYWDREYVEDKNRRNREFMMSFLQWAEENPVEVIFLTPSKYYK